MKTFFVALLSLIISTLQAQQVSLGPTAGVGHCWLTNTGADVVFNASYNVGLAFLYTSKKHLGFGAEVKYSAEGVKFSDVINSNTYHIAIESDYIRVPLKAIYFFSGSDAIIRPKVSLGPTVGFLMAANYGYEDYVNGQAVPVGSVKNDFRTFDIGAQASAGVSIKTAPRTWFNADLSYYQAFSRVDVSNTDNLMNRNICINIGLAFGIGGSK